MTLQAILIQIKQTNNLSSEQLAEIAGIATSTVYRVLSGKTKKLHTSNIEKLIEKFPDSKELFDVLNNVSDISGDIKTSSFDNQLVLLPNENGVVTIDMIVSFLHSNEEECLENEKYFLWKKNIEYKGAINVLERKISDLPKK
ncbi:helix-turn-helix transcriptional regulator [uncultured Tenacibaculum sp.]|uniref:helix-turn-helix domain-containing protein n=1 Tax=uncultured Tenacibaculum sp. TaxID=174713 RepID=UPI00261F6B27|nr:helix-turn-helix transcriptional regulator [uncultured Tenacibaculum sp.]